MTGHEQKRTAARRWPCRVLIGFGGVLVLCALAVAAVLGVLATEAGSRWAVRTAIAVLRDQGVAEVRLARVDGTLLDAFAVHGVEVADADGPWLSAARLAVDWRPLALLSGRLEIDTVETRDVDVLRPPAGPETAAPEDAGTFNPMILARLRVQSFAADGVHLGAGVLGTEVTFRTEGRVLGRMPGDIRVETRLQRLDGPGLAALEATYAADGTLDIAAEAVEPSGLIARLAGLPGDAATRLRVQGTGPADDWRGTLEAGVENVAALAGDVALSLTPAARTVALDLRLTPGAGAPEALRAFARPVIAVRADATAEDGRVTLQRVEAASDGWQVHGSGAVAEDGTLRGDLTADLSDGAPVQTLAGVALGRAHLAAMLSGTLDAPRLAATLEARESLVDSLTAEAEAVFGKDIELAASGRLAGVDAAAPDLVTLVGEGVDWRLSGALLAGGTRARIDSFTAEGDQVTADVAGTVSLEPVGFQGTVKARVARLAALAPLTGAPLAGDLRLKADIEHGGRDRTAGPVTVTVDGFSVGDAVADRLIGGRLSAGGRVEVTPDGLTLADLEVEAPGARLSAPRLALPAFARVEGSLEAEVPSLALLDIGVVGGVRAAGTVDGPLDAPRIVADVAGDGVAAADIAFAPLRAKAEVTAAEVKVSALETRVLGMRVTGTSRLPYDTGLIAGDLEGRLADPVDIARLTGVSLDGPAAMTVRLRPEKGVQTARAVLDARDVALPQAEARVSALNARADVQDLFGAMRASLEARLASGAIGPVAWTDAAVTARVDGAQSTATIALSGSDDAGGRARAEADVSFGGPVLEGRLSAFSLDGAGHKVRLLAPAGVRVGADEIALRSTRLAVDEGRLSIEARRGPKDMAAEVTGRDLPLDLLDLVFGADSLTGTADLSASLSGPRRNPRGTVSASLRNVRVPDAEMTPLGVRADGTLEGGRLAAEARIGGISDRPAVLRGALAVAFDADGIPSVPPQAPLSAAADWAGPVDAVWAFVPQVGHRLSGAAEVTARVDGTLAAPAVEGSAVIRGGTYENLEWGTVLGSLEARARLTRDFSIAVEASGTDGGRGRVSLDGAMTPVEGGPAEVRADLEFTDAMLVRRDDLRAQADGRLIYRGSPVAGRLAGTVTTDVVEVRLTDTLGGGAPQLNVIEAGAEAGAAGADAETEAANGAGGDIALDLTVEIPARLFVRGQGLESEWEGRMAVTGTAAAPRIRGALHVRRGFVDFIGRRFDLTEGRVELSGEEDITPQISVKAEHEAEDITGILAVTGTPSDLDLAMSSRPALPQDEVLSRILFGKNFGRLGPGQAVAVAQAAVALTGGSGGGFDLTGLLRSGLGLDVLSFGGDTESGPTVEAGKYVTEDVYVGVEQGTGATSGAVSVEVEITPRISVETKGSAASGADIGINYKFDY